MEAERSYNGSFGADGHYSAAKELAGSKRAFGFALDETSLPRIDSIEVIKSSESSGWSDMAVAVTQERPHVAEHRAISSIWIGMAIEHAEVRRTIGRETLESPFGINSIVITPPGEVVEDTVLTHSRCLHLFLRESVLNEVANEIYGRSSVTFEYNSTFAAADAGLSHLLRASKQMLAERSDGSWRGDYLARAIASHVLHAHCTIGFTGSLRNATKLTAVQLRQVEEFLHASLDGHFTFGELAASVGLSRTAFFQRFSKTFEQTPQQYLQRLRIDQARMLIKAGHLTLAEVATTCGFADQTHMTRFFKKFLGRTPGQYRNDVL